MAETTTTVTKHTPRRWLSHLLTVRTLLTFAYAVLVVGLYMHLGNTHRRITHVPPVRKLTEARDEYIGAWAKEPSRASPAPPRRLAVHQPFDEKGGIILYHHIPKTGGTTVRGFLNTHADKLLTVRYTEGWKNMVKQMDELVVNGTGGKIIAFETHDQLAPAYTTLSPKIREWKRTAAENNVPLFLATTLREGLSFQISAFNFYYNAPWRKLADGTNMANATVSDFFRTMLWNPQCSFVSVGGLIYLTIDRKNGSEVDYLRTRLNLELTKEQCDQAYQVLFEDMDWIGTTESLTTETLPFLHYLVNHTNNLTKETAIINHVKKKRMRKDQLSAKHLALVQDATAWDAEWYERAQDIYQFNRFADQIGSEFFITPPRTRSVVRRKSAKPPPPPEEEDDDGENLFGPTVNV